MPIEIKEMVVQTKMQIGECKDTAPQPDNASPATIAPDFGAWKAELIAATLMELKEWLARNATR